MFRSNARLTKQLRNNVGMTLIEILIVLAIIGTLMAVLIPQVTSRLDKSKIGQTRIAMGQVVNALNLYYTDCGKFPQSLEGLEKADADCPNWGPEAYLKKTPKDAWNRDFAYSIEGANFILKSLGKDGKEGGDGFNKDLTSDDN
jgi:general secretion pathway protein G